MNRLFPDDKGGRLVRLRYRDRLGWNNDLGRLARCSRGGNGLQRGFQPVGRFTGAFVFGQFAFKESQPLFQFADVSDQLLSCRRCSSFCHGASISIRIWRKGTRPCALTPGSLCALVPPISRRVPLAPSLSLGEGWGEGHTLCHVSRPQRKDKTAVVEFPFPFCYP